MATVKEDFIAAFDLANLKKIYHNEMAKSRAVGVDNITPWVFERDIDHHLSVIERKVTNNTYEFSRYKQKLLSKGRDSLPREICIPTIRDKLVMKALNQFLQKRLAGRLSQPIPQVITRDIKARMGGEYDWVLKFDVASFYPSIKHDILERKLSKFVRDADVLRLIMSSVRKGSSRGEVRSCGVPQGLPVSNVLAALYLRNLDIRYGKLSDSLFYQRYIDDIVVLCHRHQEKSIVEDITKYCRRLGLTVYSPDQVDGKSKACALSEEFSYLGYLYNPKERFTPTNGSTNYRASRKDCMVTARLSSKQKLVDSLVGLFTSYMHSKKKSPALLQWRLNIRITGCVSGGRGKGWLFFFSEIDDVRLLYELDNIVSSLHKRFGLGINSKSFVRAWHEIRMNRRRQKYVPNFDHYDMDSMYSVVSVHKKKKIQDLNIPPEDIRKEFWNIINYEIKSLEADIQGFS